MSDAETPDESGQHPGESDTRRVLVDDFEAAIEAGCAESAEIADHVGLSASNTRRRLRRLSEDAASRITRTEKTTGQGYVYGLEAGDAEAGADLAVFGDRDYDWAARVPPPDATEYVESDGEFSDFEAIIEGRNEESQLPRSRWTGPPGTGKTTAARWIAAKRQWPLITIQVTASMRDSELLGSPHLIGGESVWVDSHLVKALLCSQERPVVVLLDEINRAPFERKSSLQPFLDHRCQVTLTLRGGEVITGDPSNLVTVATMNEGAEYETFPIDPAERRRHGNTYPVPYLGLVDKAREVDIVVSETSATEAVATLMVEGANEVRRLVEDPTAVIQQGIATSVILEWAHTAANYKRAGRPNPLGRAIQSAVVDAHYDEAGPAVEAVLKDAVSAGRNVSEGVTG